MATPPRPSPDTTSRTRTGGTTPGRPTVRIPPARQRGAEKEKFIAWARKRGATAKVAADIWYWANFHDLDAYYWASVLKHESGFQHRNKDGTIKSSGQADGIGQIAHFWIGKQIPWEPQGVVFTADNNGRTGIQNYGVNLRFSGFYLAEGVQKYGYDGAYLKHYNQADPNRERAWQRIQATYKTSGRGPLAPSTGPGQRQDAGTSAFAGPTDPFVAGVDKKGKLSLTSDPNKAVRFDGIPIRRSEFLQLKRQLEDTYVTFTGERPSNRQVMTFIAKGWSVYSLTVALSKTKAFKNSPIWASRAPGYTEASENLLAPGEKLDDELVRNAIVNNWDAGTFQYTLRQRPGYVKSNEFKGRTATMTNIFSTIYGVPDEGAFQTIQQATLAGWSPDQFASWLRGQDEYRYTPEYRDKAVRLVEELGFMTGQVPVLRQGPMAPGTPDEGLPTDPRLPGEASLPTGPALIGGTRG